ncbi:unnamed protein product [Cuscuta campestris]|uniref:Reverse transcriptase domain-containing protein n=1 Tax=Cuscuta campestris TaxID=132261 RepID=A0A484LUT7_9ASTE|nr:unnamed protein product [Cuscuta campestris]
MTNCITVDHRVEQLTIPQPVDVPRALFIIASAIGRPLKLDESTLRFSRPELARFCVEIDVSKPPPSKIHINLGGKDLFLQLVYENIPHYCSSCSKLGHLKGHCRNQELELKQPVQIRENKGKEITGEKWTVITSERGGSEAIWKRKLGPSSSGPGECSKSCEAQQLQDKDKETPVPVVPCPTPAASSPIYALLDPTRPQGQEVIPDSEGNNMALVLWKPMPIAQSKFSPLLQLEEENESDESDYEDLGIISVYGKNTRIDRLNLWESLIDHNPEAKPWMVGGDFNTITSYTEHQATFSKEYTGNLGDIIANIPTVINDLDNQCITTLPLEEEIKAAIWQLNPNSSAGRDGYNGEFFKHFWDIIKADLISATHEYFQGIPIPMDFGSTNIALIPKVEGAREIGDYRPIALSTFFSKMLSRIVANRLGPLLNKLISPEQAGFQKGKGIEEHILLTNELMHNLDSKVRGGNVMIKQDMAKDFDKISWNYLQAVLQAFGFNEQSISLLLQNFRATYMSVLVNGKPNGFFKIMRGVKHGDPLSPLLFIIGSEGFSRSLNHAINSGYISPYKVGKNRVISHLTFVDDLIIFLKGNLRNILRFRHLLDSYLKASGQEVNKKKSRIFCKKGSRGLYTRKLEDTLGFKVGNPPFKYLGSTITRGKLKKTHCDHILHHFDAYINNWYSKELNPMSRLILIKHVLSAIPMHTLAVQDLPKSIIRTIHGKLANFFWGSKQGRNHYHWAKWDTLTRPTGEGGAYVITLHRTLGEPLGNAAEILIGMSDKQKKKKVRGAGKCEKLYKRRREVHPPIEFEWDGGERVRGPDHYGETPICLYNYIEPKHWEEFQIQNETEEAKALSKKNRDLQKKNPYPHFMGRGGYAMLQHELAASQATTSANIAGLSTEMGSQLEREDSWLRGHTLGRLPEDTDPALMEIRDRIVQLNKEVAAGTFVPDGHNDVLTRALGTAEHPGG